MAQIILDIPDISCAHCERTILSALQPQAGVQQVQVNIPAKTVALQYDDTALSLDQVRAILDDEGYPVTGTHASNA